LTYVTDGFYAEFWLGELDNENYSPIGRYKVATNMMKIFGGE
jgi:hypothetical protein